MILAFCKVYLFPIVFELSLRTTRHVFEKFLSFDQDCPGLWQGVPCRHHEKDIPSKNPRNHPIHVPFHWYPFFSLQGMLLVLDAAHQYFWNATCCIGSLCKVEQY